MLHLVIKTKGFCAYLLGCFPFELTGWLAVTHLWLFLLSNQCLTIKVLDTFLCSQINSYAVPEKKWGARVIGDNSKTFMKHYHPSSSTQIIFKHYFMWYNLSWNQGKSIYNRRKRNLNRDIWLFYFSVLLCFYQCFRHCLAII